MRLYELRTEKELSQRQIANIFDISQSTYNNWENSKSEPSITQLIELAKFFGVSVDYLIGNSDDLGNINYDDVSLNPNELELLKLYKSLPVSARKNILDLMKNIK